MDWQGSREIPIKSVRLVRRLRGRIGDCMPWKASIKTGKVGISAWYGYMYVRQDLDWADRIPSVINRLPPPPPRRPICILLWVLYSMAWDCNSRGRSAWLDIFLLRSLAVTPSGLECGWQFFSQAVNRSDMYYPIVLSYCIILHNCPDECTRRENHL